MPDNSRTPRIFAKDPAGYSSGDAERAFEQYRMYVADIGRLERLRGSTNTFYLSANTGFTAALAALAGFAAPGNPGGAWLIAGCIAGLVLGYRWLKVLRSYATLATAKWEIVTKVEETLPLRLYQAEWDSLKSNPKEASYVELTATERRIPVVFILIYSFFVTYIAFFEVWNFFTQLAGGV